MIVLRYMAGVYLGGYVMFKCYWDICDKCNCTKLSDCINVCGRCVLRVKGLIVLFRAHVMMLLRSEVRQQGVPKGIWAVFISNCAIRSFFYVLRFLGGGGGTEGKCDMLTQLIGLFGAAVVAWYARDVLGWAICYGR